jgi:RHS repeat-associated protein
MKTLSSWLPLLLALAAFDAAAQKTVQYYHTDALGTPVAITSESKVVLERRYYEPYGKLLDQPVEDGPGYTGHVSDAATGLSYMQQRYYDPQLGIFYSVDPVSVLTNPVSQFNLYRYANGNPYAFTDPDGRQSHREAHEARRRESFCNTGCNAGSFATGGAKSPEMFVVNNAPQYVANFYDIDPSQVEFTNSEYDDCAQTMYCSVRFNAKAETAYLSYPQTGVAPAAGFRSAGGLAKQLIGKGFPTKLNRAGRAQPYNPANGQYLPAVANPGLKLSPVSRFSSGFAEGFNEAKGSGVPGVPIGKAGGWGYMLGYFLGQF